MSRIVFSCGEYGGNNTPKPFRELSDFAEASEGTDHVNKPLHNIKYIVAISKICFAALNGIYFQEWLGSGDELWRSYRFVHDLLDSSRFHHHLLGLSQFHHHLLDSSQFHHILDLFQFLPIMYNIYSMDR